ncbi:hypothetical protein [Mesorhizobium sp.]|uniref:hypothetical protein n=1 Tax=Mesorhizobium sp. TaxID=1871066 RepID=UPI0011F6199E|nr:hypothetical protein [Mesorhizobium sp.]TIS63882.1 MAG: hypothetical protein E5W92_25895 [Mesorhizobium sp.]
MTLHQASNYQADDDLSYEGCTFGARRIIVPEHLGEQELNWLLSVGVPVPTIVRPTFIKVATGTKARDGLFEPTLAGDRWLVVETEEDLVFWNPRSNMFATDVAHAFALGDEMITAPGTYSFDCALNIFAHPLDWLRRKRDGIVVLPDQWHRAFEQLRDAPRIALAESLLPHYRRHMRPSRMPELLVMTGQQVVAC